MSRGCLRLERRPARGGDCIDLFGITFGLGCCVTFFNLWRIVWQFRMDREMFSSKVRCSHDFDLVAFAQKSVICRTTLRTKSEATSTALSPGKCMTPGKTGADQNKGLYFVTVLRLSLRVQYIYSTWQSQDISRLRSRFRQMSLFPLPPMPRPTIAVKCTLVRARHCAAARASKTISLILLSLSCPLTSHPSSSASPRSDCSCSLGSDEPKPVMAYIRTRGMGGSADPP